MSPRFPAPYRPLSDFIAPLMVPAGRRSLWRIVVGLILIFALYWGVLTGGVYLIRMFWGGDVYRTIILSLQDARTPLGLVLMLASFAALVLACAVTTWIIDRRPLTTLIAPPSPNRAAAAGKTAVMVASVLIGLGVLFVPLQILDPAISATTAPMRILAWLPVALPLLMIQISAEEIVFRGWLLQHMAARFHSPFAWMVVPSVLFGALHYDPTTFGPMAFWPVLWAVGFGCLAADLTARTGNLGAALGLHFANNFAAFFLVGLHGQMDGLALFTLSVDTTQAATLAPSMALDAANIVVSWLLIRVLLRV